MSSPTNRNWQELKRLGRYLKKRPIVVINYNWQSPDVNIIANSDSDWAGDKIKRKNWEVKSSLAEHVQPFLDSLAYRLEINGKSIVFTGDTRPCESVEKLARGADYLISLCIALQDQISGTPEADYMMGHIDAGTMAKNAKVKI